MAGGRMEKKKMQRFFVHQMHEVKGQMERQESVLAVVTEKMNKQQEMLEMLGQQMAKQQDILNMYYKEYQILKQNNEKQYLLTYIRMRESMLKDMEKYKARGLSSSYGCCLLKMYVNEYTDLLEDKGVEILECKVNDRFDPEIEKPIKRVDVERQEDHDLVREVYSCGYRWNGFLLKKIDVAVGIFK